MIAAVLRSIHTWAGRLSSRRENCPNRCMHVNMLCVYVSVCGHLSIYSY